MSSSSLSPPYRPAIPAPPARGFGRLALGLLVIVADLRIEDVDLIPDVVGWVLVVAGALLLRARHDAYRWVVGLGVAGGVLSVPETVGAHWTSAGEALIALVQCGVVLALCVAGYRTASYRRDAYRAIGIVTVVGSVVAALIALADPANDSPLVVPAFLAVVAVLGVTVWLIVLLFRERSAAAAVSVGNHPPS